MERCPASTVDAESVDVEVLELLLGDLRVVGSGVVHQEGDFALPYVTLWHSGLHLLQLLAEEGRLHDFTLSKDLPVDGAFGAEEETEHLLISMVGPLRDGLKKLVGIAPLQTVVKVVV